MTTHDVIKKVKIDKCYYSSAVVKSFQYLWSAVVAILLRTRAMFLFITCVI